MIPTGALINAAAASGIAGALDGRLPPNPLCRFMLKEFTMSFEGYSPAALDFLWGIRTPTSERGWFLAHKEDYRVPCAGAHPGAG